MDGTLNNLIPLFEIADEFEETMQRNFVISIAPGTFIIGGVFLLHFGIAVSMGIFYLSCFAGLGNVLWPLVRHREKEEGTPQLPDKGTNNSEPKPLSKNSPCVMIT